MAVIRLPSFQRSLKRLPQGTRELADEQICILQNDPRDPRLHIKKLHKPLEGTYSFRITRRYRGLFYFDVNNDIIIFDVDHRKDIYR